MKNDARLPVWRDWMLFAVKWFALLLFAAAIYLVREQALVRDPFDGVLLAFVVGAVANTILALLLLFNVPSAVEPVVAIGDVLTAAFFAQLASGDPVLLVSIGGLLMLSGLLRLGPVFSIVQNVGIVASTTISLVLIDRAGGQTALSTGEATLPLLILAGFALTAIAASFALYKHVGAQQKRIAELAKGETATLQHMRVRTRAIYDLSTTISSTLNYDQILAAALEAGHLALRPGNNHSLTSAVLLYREDGLLHVAAARRLTRNDENVLLRGTDGVIGQALKEAVPIFGAGGSKDADLQYFSAFHYCRSILAVPLRANFDNYGVIVYGAEEPNAFDEEQTELLSAIGSQACMALQNAVLYSSLREEKERLVEVEEDARKKLARDLHDGPTQSVSAIAMRMSYIYKLFEKKPQEVPDELKKVEDLARKTAKEIRHMLFTLRPLVLETQGLSAALIQLGEKMQETHGQAVAVRMGRDIDSYLTPHQQGILFYIVEEAVNNARKHAQAELISVTVGRQERKVICQIADNGTGFDTSIVTKNYEKRGSLGMVNMRERVELIGGTLRLESAPGKGTCITIVIPISPENDFPAVNGNGAHTRATKLASATIERVESTMR